MLAVEQTVGEMSESLSYMTTAFRRMSSSQSKSRSPKRRSSQIKWSQLEDLSFLGKGAFCIVYKATYQGTTVAVKKLRPDVKTTTGQRLMYSEFQILERLLHENVVKLIGHGTSEDPIHHVFLVIEYVEDGTLAEFLSSRLEANIPARVPLVDCLEFGAMFASAMCYLHHDASPSGVILHRDLKPDNIGFSNGSLKLMDFGLAKVMPRSTMENKTYKMTGDTGTLRYMAPEVAVHKPYNEKADVYSFSLIFWQVLTLQRPFEGMNSDEYFEQVVKRHVRPIIDPQWPVELGELLARCWHRKPHHRPNFPEIVDCIDELKDIVGC